MSRKVHLRTVLLLSAARPSINLTFSCKVFYSSSFLRKTDPQSTNYLKNRRDTLSLTTIVIFLLIVKKFEPMAVLDTKRGHSIH